MLDSPHLHSLGEKPECQDEEIIRCAFLSEYRINFFLKATSRRKSDAKRRSGDWPLLKRAFYTAHPAVSGAVVAKPMYMYVCDVKSVVCPDSIGSPGVFSRGVRRYLHIKR